MPRPLKSTGFLCPKCTSRMDVKDSRDAEYLGQPSVRRQRRCPACRTRLTTFEVVDPAGLGDRMADLIEGLRLIGQDVALVLRVHDAKPGPDDAAAIAAALLAGKRHP